MHGLAHLFVNFGYAVAVALVVPAQTHAPRNLLNDPQVRLGLAGRVNRLFAQLHHAVGVADGAILLGPGRGGQHHIGQPGGLCHKDILHHQVLERCQCVARMVQVGVAHGGVLAHDVHAMHLVRVTVIHQRLVHDFDHGVARLVVQRHAPEIFKPVVRGLIGHTLVVGVHHGDQARVTGTLHVILATQWVQAGAGFADLTGHRHQCDEAARVIRAVYVLAHAHAPQNHRAFGLGERAGYLANRLRRNAADRLHGLRAVALDVIA